MKLLDFDGDQVVDAKTVLTLFSMLREIKNPPVIARRRSTSAGGADRLTLGH
jgi:hypothetical protein